MERNNELVPDIAIFCIRRRKGNRIRRTVIRTIRFIGIMQTGPRNWNHLVIAAFITAGHRAHRERSLLTHRECTRRRANNHRPNSDRARFVLRSIDPHRINAQAIDVNIDIVPVNITRIYRCHRTIVRLHEIPGAGAIFAHIVKMRPKLLIVIHQGTILR